MRQIQRLTAAFGLAVTFASAAGAASAQVFDWVPEARTGGKLLLTGGVSTVEGSGGGGIATWALTTGYGAEDGVGGNVDRKSVV